MKSKILVIDRIYPFPENIGRRMRTMNFVRFFQEYGTVDLLYFVSQSKEVEDPGIFHREYCIPYEGIPDKNWVQSLNRRWTRLMEGRPWLVRSWSPRTVREIEALIEKENYDIVLCRYIYDTYPLFRMRKQLRERVILDFDDVLSKGGIYDSEVKYGDGLRDRLKKRIEKMLLERYEKKCLEFGASLFVSRSDLREIAGQGKSRNAYIVPNSFPYTVSSRDGLGDGYPNRNTFLFIGALFYEPNIAGLKWFLEKIFANIQMETKNARLFVVGGKPTPEVIRLCDEAPNVELHADVPDVEPYYQRCGIVVVPILTGGGSRIKILEAGIACRAVLSTPMGASGLDVVDGKDLIQFRDRDTFLAGLRALDDREKYGSIVSSMESLVRNRYSPESFRREMADAVKSFL